MPSNRVSDCRASGATRNEDWSGSPPVNRNKGEENENGHSTVAEINRRWFLGFVRS